MTKEKLIIEILKKEIKSLKKTLKQQESQIKDIQKNGFDSEIHPAYHVDIKTGLHYTSGYCTGHIALAENIIELLEMKDAKDIEHMLEENKKIELENKKYLNKIFKDISKEIEDDRSPKKKIEDRPSNKNKNNGRNKKN